MSTPRPPDPQRDGRLFFGRVTAGQTHEITNVLNIISEYAGLLDDLTTAAEQGRVSDPARFHELARKIRAQVDRGEQLCQGLNRFAHSVDVSTGMLDADDLLERLVAITERPVRLGRARLDVVPPAAPVAIEAPLFDVLRLMYECVELAIQAGGGRRHLEATWSVEERGIVFRVTSADSMSFTGSMRPVLKRLEQQLESLGGRLDTRPARDGGRCLECLLHARPGRPA